MKEMRVLIIDTNPEDAEQLSKALCSEHPEIITSVIFSTIQSAFEWLNQYGQPDLVFMEIQLSDGLSFEILNYLDTHVKVVFTLPFNKCVVEIFENQSVRYLLKPFNPEQARFDLNLRSKNINRIELYESLLNLYFPRPCKKPMRRIIVKKGSEFHIIPIKDVVYFTSDNGIVFFVTKENHKHMMSGTLCDINSQLDNNLFYKANRNFIVNSSFLKGFRRIGYKIVLIFTVPIKDEIFVNSYRVTDFKDWLENTQTGALIEG